MAGNRDARQRILDAPGGLGTMEGVGAAPPAAIAERAGAGKMSLYRHFSGKDELVAEALAERDPAYRVLLLGGPTPLPARERLPAVVDRAAAAAARRGCRFFDWPDCRARPGGS